MSNAAVGVYTYFDCVHEFPVRIVRHRRHYSFTALSELEFLFGAHLDACRAQRKL